MADETENSSSGSRDLMVPAARRVLENLAEMEPELVGAGIFRKSGPGRELLYTASGSPGWTGAAEEVLDALEAGAGEESFDSAHVAGATGEVFVVTECGFTVIAVTGRFVLASLTAYDLRMALRDLNAVQASSQAEYGEPESA
ncbi:MAG TPA: hypothetical protein PKD76_01585 [Solirubrobacterales bacterium]|nr:hypothetical protein [Solirubrobacterales bacterium]